MKSREEIEKRIKEMKKDKHYFTKSEQKKFDAGILALEWVLSD